jgi:hypothetical protein
MTERAIATFAIRSWEERPFDELDDGSKLTRASVVKRYQGELAGEGTLEQLMAYSPEGTAVFTAFERFRGTLGERAGTFVLRHDGIFERGVARDTWTIVPGTATGDLRGLYGTVRFEAGHEESYPVVFEYWFEEAR